MEDARKIVNRRINELRDNLGMTQPEFAKKLGLDGKKGRSTINNWETGNIQVKSDDLILISETFNVTTDWLLGRKPKPSAVESISDAANLTGLSVEAIKMLHSDSFDIQSKEFICRLITEYGGDSHNIYAYIASAIESKIIVNRNRIADHMKSYPLKEESKKAWNAPPDGCETLPAKQVLDFKLSEAANLFRRLVEVYVDEVAKNMESVKDAPNDGTGPHFNDTWGYQTKEEE